jgi:isocitrate/isopropylmalate dehydrogenase
VLSAGLMLNHLGEDAAGAELDAAVNSVLAAGAPATTGEWEKALLAQLTGEQSAARVTGGGT